MIEKTQMMKRVVIRVQIRTQIRAQKTINLKKMEISSPIPSHHLRKSLKISWLQRLQHLSLRTS
jgi:pyruvate kinase